MRLHNSLTGEIEEFVPLREGEVSLYHCGPTVYKRQHIGNFRAFMFADLLRRTFEYFGYRVKQVMNITDVGHLTEDDVADAQGEDKLQREAKEPGRRSVGDRAPAGGVLQGGPRRAAHPARATSIRAPPSTSPRCWR